MSSTGSGSVFTTVRGTCFPRPVLYCEWLDTRTENESPFHPLFFAVGISAIPEKEAARLANDTDEIRMAPGRYIIQLYVFHALECVVGAVTIHLR